MAGCHSRSIRLPNTNRLAAEGVKKAVGLSSPYIGPGIVAA